MNALCDLHNHTTASDGSFAPAELVDYAHKKGAAAIAVTDHDTIEGLAEAMARGEEIGQYVIPGIEITTNHEEREIHIVGLFVDYKNAEFDAAVEKMAKTRDMRNYQMVEKLKNAGLNICWDDMKRFEGCILTKAHIGRILIERGYANDLKEAMNKYMYKGTIGYVARVVPKPEECIELIHMAGGLAFVAHTNQIDPSSREHSVSICRYLIEHGADGLETRYCEFDDDWRSRTEAIAKEYGVLRSGGSDFHGTYKKGLDMLTGYGDLSVPYEYVEAIEKRLGRK